MIRNTLRIGAGLAALSVASSGASAATTFGNVSPTKSPGGDFIAGNGIHADSFTIDSAVTGETTAVAVRDRATGNALSIDGNRYYVSAGTTGTGSGTRARWNFDFQFSPGVGSVKLATDYTYEIQFDTNPAAGVANFTTISVPNTLTTGAIGDSYFPNGTGGQITAGPTYGYNGAWSDATPWVIANSQNYAFSHFLGSTFANNAYAEYDLVFTAKDAVTGLPVVSTSVVAVVPEPASVALIGLGGGALLLRRRRGGRA